MRLTTDLRGAAIRSLGAFPRSAMPMQASCGYGRNRMQQCSSQKNFLMSPGDHAYQTHMSHTVIQRRSSAACCENAAVYTLSAPESTIICFFLQTKTKKQNLALFSPTLFGHAAAGRCLPAVGFEPTRSCLQWILSPPPRPLGQICYNPRQ